MSMATSYQPGPGKSFSFPRTKRRPALYLHQTIHSGSRKEEAEGWLTKLCVRSLWILKKGNDAREKERRENGAQKSSFSANFASPQKAGMPRGFLSDEERREREKRPLPKRIMCVIFGAKSGRKTTSKTTRIGGEEKKEAMMKIDFRKIML